jgi:glycine cleavage system aminomethyltransferase T
MLFREDTVARAQHDLVRNNVAWFRWTHDLVEVTGRDAAAFLDYIYVNSIAKAPVGASKYTAMLNEEGGIIDDVIVTHLDEGTWWISTLYAPRLMPWIDAHKGDYDIAYQERTHEIDMYAVQGPNSLKFMNRLLAAPIDDLGRFQMAENKAGGISVRIHRSGFTGELGYEIYCTVADSKALAEALAALNGEFSTCELDVLEVYVRSLPVEKGLALRQDLYGLSPYEAGLGWSVDLSKDFIGKQPVERVREEGPARKLVGLEFEAESYEDINQGEIVYRRGVPVGFVTAAIYGYTVDKNIGFGVVSARKAEAGTRVTVGPNDSPAVIVEKNWV